MKELSFWPARRAVWATRGMLLVGAVTISVLLLFGLGASAMLSWGLRALPELVLLTGSLLVLQVIPGLALLRLLWPDQGLGWSGRLALAWGLGFGLPALVLELAQLLGVAWSSWATLAYCLAAVLVLAWPLRRGLPAQAQTRRLALSEHSALLLGLLGLALLVRLYLIRDLPVGLWGDSYHHTMIAQLLVDNGGLFSSWQPYAPLVSFTYHYGFHANVAFFHWLSGIPVTTSLLYVGQMMSTATLALAYVLTLRVTGSRAAGLWAALLTGFVNTQPVFYVNWGRYTQLTGQLILPVVIVAWMAVLEQERLAWRRLLLAALVTACLMLTHYLVTLLAALFLLAYVVVLLVRDPRWQQLLQIGLRASACALLALLFSAPWLINTLQGYLLRNTTAVASQGTSAANAALLHPAPDYLKAPILALALAGLLIAAARRDWRAALPALWTLLLLFAVVPYALALPGTGVITAFAAYIMLYLPVIPLASYALGTGQGWLGRRFPHATRLVVVGLMLAIAAWGCTWQQQLADPNYQLLTHADMQAMAWIREQTPPDARFLVNSFPAYAGTLVAGSDGGWWLPLLTGRQSNLPPLNYGSERGPEPDYSRQVGKFWASLRGRPLTDMAPVRVDLTTAEALAVLQAAGIDYIYKGRQAHPGPEQADSIDVALLQARPDLFQLVYNHDGVQIFALQARR